MLRWAMVRPIIGFTLRILAHAPLQVMLRIGVLTDVDSDARMEG
jgi:hypothetical protein